MIDMNLKKGVFLDLASVDRGDVDLSALLNTGLDWTLHDATKPDETAARVKNAQVIISNKVVLERSVLATNTGIRLICIAATGTNNVDLKAAQEFDIAVTNVTQYATSAVVQHVFSLVLALATHLPDYQHLIHAGHWQRSEQFCLLDYPILELQGKVLGIVGYGALGRAVASIAEAFGMQVLISQRPGGAQRPGRIPFDELLARADVLSLHCPLTEDTRNLIGPRDLAMMKTTALLINTARGGIVDEQALAGALSAGRIGGAGIDVLTTEPPRKGNSLLDPAIPNLIVTPHIAWATRESRQRVIEELVKNIEAFMRSAARNRII